MKKYLTDYFSQENITLTLWIVIVLSIGAKNQSFETVNFIKIINQLRYLFIPIILPILLIYFTKKKIIKINNSIVYKNFFVIFASLQLILSLIGFFNFKFFNENLYFYSLLSENPYKPNFLYALYYPLSFFIVSIFFFLYIKKEFIDKIIVATIIITLIITIYSLYLVYSDYLKFEHIIFYYSNTLNFSDTLGNPNIRVTSLARMLCILLIFSSLFYLTNKKKTITVLGLILIYFILVNLYLLQSRTSLYFGIVVVCFILFKRFNPVIAIIIGLMFFSSLKPISINVYLIKEKFRDSNVMIVDRFKSIEENQKDKDTKIKKMKDNVFFNLRQNNKINDEMDYEKKLRSISTGRSHIWKKIYSASITKSNNFIFGYGPMSDRFLTNQNASSGWMYMLITTGILGLLSFLFLYFEILFNFFRYIVKNKFRENKINTSVIIIIFLLFRTIVENSFLVFGYDFCIFILSYFILQNFKFANQNRK